MSEFFKDHFDHILLVVLGLAGGAAGAWCDAHHMPESSKWMFVEAAAALSALLMRMNRQATNGNGTSPKVP